jgi:hypothetical protein
MFNKKNRVCVVIVVCGVVSWPMYCYLVTWGIYIS